VSLAEFGNYRQNTVFVENDRKRAKSLSFLFSDVFTVLVSVLSVTVTIFV
jgi:hypothetical protein